MTRGSNHSEMYDRSGATREFATGEHSNFRTSEVSRKPHAVTYTSAHSASFKRTEGERAYRRSAARKPEISSGRTAVSADLQSMTVEQQRMRASASLALRSRTTAPKIRTIKSAKVKPFPTVLVVMSLVCTMLFMFMVFNTVKINEFSRGIASMQSELNNLMSEKKELELKLDQKNDLREIEKIATEKLGMVKNDNVERAYISINSEDKIEVTYIPKTAPQVTFSTVLSSIGRNFESFLEYIN